MSEPPSGLKRRNYGRNHGYVLDGVKIDGVTTLIKGGLPAPALMHWAARSVAEHVADNFDAVMGMQGMGREAIVAALKQAPWTKRDQAAARGTEVHTFAEKVIGGDEVEVPEHLIGHVESCVAMLDAWQVRPVLVEVPVGSRRWRYGGTLDLVADVMHPRTGETQRALLDWKTAASGIFAEVSLQMAAYRNAEVYLAGGVEKPMADLGITHAYAVHLRADGYDVIPVESGEAAFKFFLHVAAVARRAKTAKEDLIGESVGV